MPSKTSTLLQLSHEFLYVLDSQQWKIDCSFALPSAPSITPPKKEWPPFEVVSTTAFGLFLLVPTLRKRDLIWNKLHVKGDWKGLIYVFNGDIIWYSDLGFRRLVSHLGCFCGCFLKLGHVPKTHQVCSYIYICIYIYNIYIYLFQLCIATTSPTIPTM